MPQMVATTALLGLVAFAVAAAAAPTTISPASTPSYPPYKTSKAFRLIINATDLTRDFAPSIQGHHLFSYIQAAGPARAGLAQANGNIFSQYYNPALNYTFPDFSGQILTSALRGPDHVLGLRQDSYGSDNGPTDRKVMYLDEMEGMGPGQPGLQVSPSGRIPQVLTGEMSGVPAFSTFTVCNVSVPRLGHGGNAWFLGLEFQYVSKWRNETVAEGCVPVKVLPECVEFVEAPEGTKAKGYEKDLKEVRCYEDVAAIDWNKYDDISKLQ